MTRFLRPVAPLLTAIALTLAACGGGGGSDTGSLRLALTDAPSCGYAKVNVTVQKVRVHQSGTASDTDAGWSEVMLSPPQRLDLLTLSNGVLAELGQTPLPTGHYTQMRLVLTSNDAANPLANAVLATGAAAEAALSTPSAQQSGLKMNVNIDVAADKLADFVLDFNACKSVIAAGASGNYLLKPVVSVTPRYVSGVAGYVDSSVANGNTTVSVQQGGVVVKATSPDSTGKFLLQPVAPGTYDLVITAPARLSTVITGVSVVADTATSLNIATAPVTLASATTGTASGSVTTLVAPIDATVRVLQTLSNSDKIEIAGGPVNAATGLYSYALSASAPMVAAYAPAKPLTFTSDVAAGAKYSLEAASAGTTKTAGPIAITAGAAVSTNFAF